MKNFIISKKKFSQCVRVFLIVATILYAYKVDARAPALAITATIINGTCSGDGQLNVSASGGTAPYKFNLTAGPAGISYPTFYQSGTNFSSLKPGIYTVQVQDGAGSTASIVKTVTTSYVSLNISSVNITANHCPGSPDGIVKMNVTAGKLPYSYELLSGATIVKGPQAANTFTGVTNGVYTAQVTDGCGEIRSFSSTVALLDWTFIPAVKTQDNNFFGAGGGSSTPPAPFDSTKNLGSGVGPLLFTCDSVAARFSNFMLQSTSNTAPRRIWVKDLNTAKIIFDQTYTPSNTYRQESATLKMKVHTNYRIYYSDLCNNLDSTDRNYNTQTSYTINGSPLKLCNGYKMNVQWFNDYNTKNSYSCPKDTIIIIASSLAGDTAIGKFTIHDKLMGNTWDAAIPGITPGNTYTIRVNTCCSSYVKTQFIGASHIDASTLILRDAACKINTAAFVINSNYLPVTPGYLLYTITSGPSGFVDTRGNVFNITYPIKDSTPVTSTQNNVYIRNFPKGNYTINVRDQCGTMQTLNTTVTETDVAKLAANITVNPQCSGASSITFNGVYQHVAGNIVLYKKTGSSYSSVAGTSVFATTAELPASYTFTGLADGDYRVAFFSIGMSGLTYGVNSPVNSCDTLFVQDVNVTYRLPSFSPATNGFVCTSGTNDGRAVLKGLDGARPYIYQRLLIADNTIVTTQTDSVFTGLAKGMYRFRIIDNCGNGIISDVTVDTLLALSIGHQGTFCAGTNATFYSSPLALESAYLWTGPGGFSSTNDTVSFNPITILNVGKYFLTQSIAGCNKKDSITISNCGFLPVTIIKFTGTATDNCGLIKLQWQTATESNLKEFQVQQSSDQVHFKTVLTANALNFLAGNAYAGTAIQNDKIGFYRLATIDLDGKNSYSNIIKVTENCKASADYFVIYPNPASSLEKVMVEVSSSKIIAASIIINSVNGRLLQTQKTELVKGINRLLINTKGFTPGLYTVTLTDEKNSKIKEVKLIIY